MSRKKPKKPTVKQVRSKLKNGKYVTVPMECTDSFQQVVDKDDDKKLIGYASCIESECDRLYSTTAKDFKSKLIDHQMLHSSQKLQNDFEADVNGLKGECQKLDLLSTSTCNPAKYNNNTNTTKHLPLACGYLKRKFLKKWIPNGYGYECTRSGGDRCDQTCYNLKNYNFEHSNKLYLLAVKACENGRDDVSDFTAKAIMKEIFDEKRTNCKLQVTVYEEKTNVRHRFVSYVKRVGQSRLSKSMDISQNDNRMSYGSQVYHEIAEGIVFRITCPGSVIGIGPYDLVRWRLKCDEEKKDGLIDAFEPESAHLMIYIPDSFESMSNIDIAVGYTKDVAISNVCCEVIGAHLQEYNGKLTLYLSPLITKDDDGEEEEEEEQGDEVEKAKEYETSGDAIKSPTKKRIKPSLLKQKKTPKQRPIRKTGHININTMTLYEGKEALKLKKEEVDEHISMAISVLSDKCQIYYNQQVMLIDEMQKMAQKQKQILNDRIYEIDRQITMHENNIYISAESGPIVIPESAPIDLQHVVNAVYGGSNNMQSAATTISNVTNQHSRNINDMTTNIRYIRPFQSSNGFGNHGNRIHDHLHSSNVQQRRIESHIEQMRRNMINCNWKR